MISLFDITFESKLESNKEYILSYQGLKDCAGNTSKKNEISFVLPELADSLDILFNEIMFDPVAGGAEYIEIINISDKYIDLFNWRFVRIVDGEVRETTFLSQSHLIIKPGAILVFTENKNILLGQFPYAHALQILETDIVPLNNDEGTISLKSKDGHTIDMLYYHEDYHHTLIDNTNGVSLERISYIEGSSNKEIWQSASSTVGGGTPTLPNSQYISSESNSSFSIEPKVFAPDNDGYLDFASINFTLDNPGNIASIYIFDLSGRIIKTLINHQNIPAEGNIIWEGDNDNGIKVPIGNYIVHMELTEPNGNKKAYKDTVAVTMKF